MEQSRTRYSLTPKDVADHFRVTAATVRNWCARGWVDCHRVGGRWGIHEDVIAKDAPFPKEQDS